MSTISLTINGKKVEVPEGSTVIEACRASGTYIPTLCYHPDLPPAGKCGVCLVKVDGNKYCLSCSTKAKDGMHVVTNTPDVVDKARQAFHNFKDMSMMPRTPEIEEVFKYFDPKTPKRLRPSEDTHSLSFDADKCIDCGRCVRACADGQAIGALNSATHKFAEGNCISCGQCTVVCPTDCLLEKDDVPLVLKAIAKGKIVVMQTAPSTRVAAGECFGDPVGTKCAGKIVAAAKEMGFRYVFDTNYGADMTIMEEGTELIDRLTNNKTLPMFTSCCPAWVNFVEKIHPEIIPHLSTAKSPHMMLGSIIKTYWAEKMGYKREDIFSVSLMPCTAKKDEIQRKQMKGDVDAVLTVREFGKMCKTFGINWEKLDNTTPFDKLVSDSTGAAALFGVTGGVMEAAIRFAHEQITHQKLGKVEYNQWRGFKGIKTAETSIGGINLKIAVCNGVSNARELIESGEWKNYTFIEVMACPCGCISGGGQPKVSSRSEALKRAKAIYEIDQDLCAQNKVTCNDNPELIELYKSYLGEPGHGRAHELLHTSYEIQTTPLLEEMRKAGDAPLVAFGSASGNASRLATQFASYIGAQPVALNMTNLQKMVKQGYAMIFCSTFGDGEYPANAEKFAELLKASTEDLSGLKYSVCALGSKDYPKFCHCGHEIDRLLHERGATRILPVVEIDAASPDKGEGAFEAWCPRVITSIGLKMPEIIVSSQFELVHYTKEDDSVHQKPIEPLGYKYGVVLGSTILTPDGYSPAMHRYTIKLPPGVTYVAGDHVAILPQNDPEAVKTVLNVLKLDGNEIIKVKTTLPDGFSVIPERVTIKELFSQYLDLNGQPTRNLIRAFKQCTNSDELRERMSELLDTTRSFFFDEMMKDTSTLDFILEYGKDGFPPLDLLMTAIPHITPRLYSIASAPSSAPHHLDLVITDNFFGESGDRSGLCTAFLRRFGLTKVAMKTQKGCFGYPEDQSRPMIMAALGCGIAPMISLLQHRESLQGQKGDSILFFGCRFRNTYPILDSILEDFKSTDALQDLLVAYSRGGTTKTYITDLMEMNPDTVWKYWSDPRCAFYYCGPARGIPDQLHNILVNISMEKGGMTQDEAEEFTNAHDHHIEAF